MKSAGWVRETPDGVSLDVKVIPRAGVTRVAGVREGRLLVRLAAAPVDGAANDALVAFLSEILKLPGRNIRVESGARSRTKQVRIAGTTVAQVSRVLSSLSTERS
jgi:uncharacterized protein (TIGR00251 family)